MQALEYDALVAALFPFHFISVLKEYPHSNSSSDQRLLAAVSVCIAAGSVIMYVLYVCHVYGHHHCYTHDLISSCVLYVLYVLYVCTTVGAWNRLYFCLSHPTCHSYLLEDHPACLALHV